MITSELGKLFMTTAVLSMTTLVLDATASEASPDAGRPGALQESSSIVEGSDPPDMGAAPQMPDGCGFFKEIGCKVALTSCCIASGGTACAACLVGMGMAGCVDCIGKFVEDYL